MVGLVNADGRVLSYGSVRFGFSFLGTSQAGTPQPGPEAEAAFLPVPGEGQGPAPGGGPVLTAASVARGVYAAEDVSLDHAGIWQVDVSAEVSGTGTLRGSSTFTVIAKPAIPVVGDRALKTKNHLPGEKGIPPGSVDSRSQKAGEVPDPILHRTTIAQAIARHHAALVVFSTPVYCVSRFCGPVTDVVEGIAKAHAKQADFIHVEIWRNFQGQVLNQAAADWILRGNDLQEPWVFLIDRSGKIAARWDNLFDPAEVEAELARVSA
jgi:hypothetical protein